MKGGGTVRRWARTILTAAAALALMCATMLHAADLDENICELYGELLSLHSSAEHHGQHLADWLSANMTRELAGQNESEVFARALAVGGVLRGLLANRYYRHRLPVSDLTRVMAESTFAILGIAQGRAAEASERVSSMQDELIAIAKSLIAY